MSRFAIVALFCEDVRVEASGQETLIGIFGDNLAVTQVPGLMSKMSIYIRCNFASDFDLKTLSHKFISPSGSVLHEIPIGQKMITDAIEQVRVENSPMLGIKISAIFAPFAINEYGRHSLLSYVNEEEYLTGFANITASPPNPGSTA